MGVIIVAIARILDLAFNIYTFIVIARALISWVNPDPYNPIVRFLHNATDPFFPDCLVDSSFGCAAVSDLFSVPISPLICCIRIKHADHPDRDSTASV